VIEGVLEELHPGAGPRTPRLAGQGGARRTTYANRRRIKSERGKALMRRRGELLERTFAHTLETGAMRRVFLRLRDNILKRYLVYVAAFNPST
jgi:hypothetical protein